MMGCPKVFHQALEHREALQVDETSRAVNLR